METGLYPLLLVRILDVCDRILCVNYQAEDIFISANAVLLQLVYVAQQYGEDRPEYVSMERLHTIKRDVASTYEQHKNRFPDMPRIPLVEATMVPAKSLFEPKEIKAGDPETVTSRPIYLQTGSNEVYSFAVDLSGLHAGIIFSVILSNSNDLLGRKSGTILVRNGVTATAARKLANKKTVWFYHGKPMNDGDMRLHVTIGRDQMTFAYYEEADGRLYVHGDCPVSRLSADHIGDVKGVPFYVHIYTKDKTASTSDHKDPVLIHVLKTEGKGYIHESVDEDERNDFGFELIQPSETVPEPDAVPAPTDPGLSSLLARMVLE